MFFSQKAFSCLDIFFNKARENLLNKIDDFYANIV